MSRRVGDITGLDMDASEDLQVCNYGIGGHYVPHFDYARVGILYAGVFNSQLFGCPKGDVIRFFFLTPIARGNSRSQRFGLGQSHRYLAILRKCFKIIILRCLLANTS